jgi:3-methyladenine DNA glycosylase AlkD
VKAWKAEDFKSKTAVKFNVYSSNTFTYIWHNSTNVDSRFILLIRNISHKPQTTRLSVSRKLVRDTYIEWFTL